MADASHEDAVVVSADAHVGATATPPLPPPPLGQRHAGADWGSIALPWSTPLFALLAGLAAAVPAGVLALAGGFCDETTVFLCGIFAAWRGLVVGVGAALGDRLLARRPRWFRWGVGTAVLALVLPIEGLLYDLLPGTGLPWPSAALWWCRWLVWPVLREGSLGGLLGLAAGSPRGLWWRLPLAGAGAMAAYVVCDALLCGPVMSLLGSWVTAETLAAGMVIVCAGAFVGLAFARGLHAGWERAGGPDSGP